MKTKKNNKEVVNEVVNPAVTSEVVEQAKKNAEVAKEEAKKAAQIAKEAASIAKEAAEKVKAFTSRPVRLARFQAELNGELIAKTDVHYCAEKAAIDYMTELRNNSNYEGQVIEIWKRYKNSEKEDVLLATVSISTETNQIVID